MLAALRAALPVLVVGSMVAGGMAVGLVAAPAQAQRIKPTFWGMHDFDWSSPPAAPVGAANLTTSGTYWYQVELLPGVYQLDRIADQLAGAGRAGARPMLLLGGTPVFHSSDRSSPDNTDMPDLDAWRDYVTAVVGRFGSRLDYQIWPEPNSTHNWSGTPAQLARLTAVAARIIRSGASGAKVVGPAMALRLPSQRRWMRQYYRQRVDGRRVHTFVDAVAVNPFAHQTGTPEASYRLLRRARRLLARLGVRRPLWTNEINYGVAGGGEPTSTRYSHDRQQAYVIRTYALGAGARVARTFWLGWFATDTMGVDMTDASGRTAPAGRAYARVHEWLSRSRFHGCSVDRRGRQHGLWTCTFRKHGDLHRLLWTRGRAVRVALPRRVTRVVTMEGRVRRPRGAAELRVDFRPVLVTLDG